MNIYKTSEIASHVGLHPNTIRLYEELELIPKAKRRENGYRVFTDFHIEQIRFARTALKIEVLQNGLRKQAISIIKTSAKGDFDAALLLTSKYLAQLKQEEKNAAEAIEITESLLAGDGPKEDAGFFTRKETAKILEVTIDTLRNWEMNGLLRVKRRQNGYRVYTDRDIRRLKMIRSLRCANYSLSAILRMLSALSENPGTDIRHVIDTPKENDDIISVCDKLLTSLHSAEKNAEQMLDHLRRMKQQFSENPTL